MNDESVALAEAEKNALRKTWDFGPFATEAHQFAAVERIITARMAQARAEALRDAADAALTMYDPPVDECIDWSEWLRARADRLLTRPGGEA